MKQIQQLYSIICFFTLAASIMIAWLVPMPSFGYALLMCLNFVWILYVVWKTDRLSPYILFLATFIFLFIGGRFWAELMMPETFSLRRGNFFDETRANDAQWFQTLTYILIFLYFATFAYLNYPRKNKGKPIICYHRTKRLSIDRMLTVVFCMLAPFVLYDIVKRLMIALTSGYLSLYAMQTEDVAAGSGIVASMLYVFFGIALVYGNDKTKKAFMLLMFAKAFVFIVIGQRAKFGSLLLFFLWYYLRDKKVNFLKVGVLVGGSLLALIAIASLSIRGGSDVNFTAPFKVLAGMLYTQGVSLTTFSCSMQIEHYPTLPYIVTFVPGAASIASLSSSIPAQDAAFGNYLAYTLDEGLYLSGHGLGWTLLSDLYLYSGRNYILFSVLSFLFGWVCAKMEDRSKENPYLAVIVFTTFLNLTFLPRAGLYTIIPLIVWIWVVYTFFDTTTAVFKSAQTYHEENQIEQV